MFCHTDRVWSLHAWYMKEEQDIRVNKMEVLTYGMPTVHVEKISYTIQSIDLSCDLQFGRLYNSFHAPEGVSYK